MYACQPIQSCNKKMKVENLASTNFETSYIICIIIHMSIIILGKLYNHLHFVYNYLR